MQSRRVVCTGNPLDSTTLASGVIKLFPDAIFLSRSTGWDLSNIDNHMQSRLSEVFAKCNTFLNCSYIAPGIQTKLLDICKSSCKFCDVVNIGSTHEYDNLGDPSYKKSKLELRFKSLEYNNFRFSTCHFVLGGIKTDNSTDKKNWLDIDHICQEIVGIWSKPYHTPLTVMDQFKTAW